MNPTRLVSRCPGLLRRFTHYMKHLQGKRPLYSATYLKMDHFRTRRLLNLDNGQEKKAALIQKLDMIDDVTQAKHSVFELMDLLYMAEREDFDLIKKLLAILSQVKSEFDNRSPYHFGAVLLRLCHHLKAPDEAYSLFKDPNYNFVFNDPVSVGVLMDLLYDHEQFDRVIDVIDTEYDSVESLNTFKVIFALGAFYHQNSDESFERSQSLLKKYSQSASVPKRGYFYAIQLALNQNKPATAYELLTHIQKRDNLTKNLTLTCQAQLGDLKAMFAELERLLSRAKEEVYHPLTVRLYSDTMNSIRQVVKRLGTAEDVKALQGLEEELRHFGALSVQVSTAFLDRPIQEPRPVLTHN